MYFLQLGNRTLRRLRAIVLAVVILGLVGYVLPNVVLRIPAVQTQVGGWVAQELSDALATEVRIGAINLLPTTNISIADVSIADTVGRLLLTADRLTAGIDIWQLLQGEVQISSARLFSPHIHLIRDSLTGRLNAEPILERLASDSPEPSNLRLAIHSILLRDGVVDYTEGESPLIRLNNINLKLRHLNLHRSNLSGIIQEFSCRTDEGFELKSLTAQVQKRGDLVLVSNLELALPDSYISIPQLQLRPSARGLSLLEQMQLSSLSLNPEDLTAFLPQLRSSNLGHLSLRAEVNGRSGVLQVRDLELALGNQVFLQAQSLVSLVETGGLQHLNLDIERLQLSPSILPSLHQLFPQLGLPNELDRVKALGEVQYFGTLNYQRGGSLQWRGLIATSLGRWSGRLDGTVDSRGRLEQVDGDLQTSGFNLAPLVGDLLPVGKIATELKLIGAFDPKQEAWSLDLLADLNQAQLNGYAYQGLKLRAHKDIRNALNFSLESNDPQIRLKAGGGVNLSSGVARDIRLQLEELDLAPELFLRHYPKDGQRFSATGKVNLSSLDWNTMLGRVELKQINLFGGNSAPIDLDQVTLELRTEANERVISLNAPGLQGVLSGQFALEQLPTELSQLATQNLPSLGLGIPQRSQAHYARLDLVVDSLPQGLTQRLGLPLSLEKPLELQLNYQTAYPKISLGLRGEALRYSDYRLDSLNLKLSEQGLNLTSNVHASGVELNQANLQLALQNDSVGLNLDLGVDDQQTDNGSINIRSLFSSLISPSGKRELAAQISILPSDLRISNEHWQIAPAHVALNRGQIEITDLALTTSKRHLLINGSISSQPSDYLTIDLERINLNYILRAAGVKFNLLETDLSGQVKAHMDKGILFTEGQVRSDHFVVNGKDAGAIDVGLTFNTQDLDILLKGDVRQTGGGHSSVSGYIRPANGAGLDLAFDAERLQVDFISNFMPEVIRDISGEGTGRMRLFGKFERGVTVAGDVEVERGRIGVAPLGTTYTFAHHLHLSPEEVLFDRVRLYDDEGNSGVIEGKITHDHFSNFSLDLRASELNGVKVYNRSIIKEIPASGVAYASGRALLRGNDKRIDLIVDATSQARTNLLLDFNRTDATKQEYSINFRPLRTLSADSLDSISPVRTHQPSILAVQLNLNVTPEARLGMRLGSGDMNELWAQGEGNIRIDMPPVGSPQVYGNLRVSSGVYTFKLEQLAHKRFALREGGRLDFRGDYRRAKIDLNAQYSLTANITDLDEELAGLARRTNVPVNCVIGITGEVLHPQIKFSLELPGAESELERRVRSLLHTEDDVTRQMFYLITLGKFYTDPQGVRQSTTSSNWTAVASSALSEQLSYLLGNLTKDVHIGTSIKTKNTSFDDTDIELLFSGSWLGNRLMFNGNLGYHDNPFLQNTYIGEFDVAYKLNPSGSIQLKGYNHYNNMYQYLRQSMTTQGLGFLFRLRFDRLKDLFGGQKTLPLTGTAPATLPRDTLVPDSTSTSQ